MIAYAKPIWLRTFFYPSTGKSELMRHAIGFEVLGPMPDPVPLTLANVLDLCEHEERVKRYKAAVADCGPIWGKVKSVVHLHARKQARSEGRFMRSGQLGKS